MGDNRKEKKYSRYKKRSDAEVLRLIREHNEANNIPDKPMSAEQKRENWQCCLIWLGIPAIIILLKSCS